MEEEKEKEKEKKKEKKKRDKKKKKEKKGSCGSFSADPLTRLRLCPGFSEIYMHSARETNRLVGLQECSGRPTNRQTDEPADRQTSSRLTARPTNRHHQMYRASLRSNATRSFIFGNIFIQIRAWYFQKNRRFTYFDVTWSFLLKKMDMETRISLRYSLQW